MPLFPSNQKIFPNIVIQILRRAFYIVVVLYSACVLYLDSELEARVHGVRGPEPADHGHHTHAPHTLGPCNMGRLQQLSFII